MEGFPKAEWTGGYDVLFPEHRRHLAMSYSSLDSADFAARLHREMPQGTIMTGREVTALDASGVTLADGQRLSARSVIDCRGFSTTDDLAGGWQVFMGRHIRTPEPHHVAHPIIMDATVEQLGGYRFVYVLPLGPQDLFIEDTYYQDEPVLDHAALSARIDDYIAANGWSGETVGTETGVLPVITGGHFRDFQKAQAVSGVALAGARGGYVHPLTSYTLPIAVDVALAVADNADLAGDELATRLASRAREHWGKTAFYRMLGKMLFGAERPELRYLIFQRFYRLPEPLIERFYAARSTLRDQLRVLVGKPPIPIPRALRALASNSPPLVAPDRKISS